MINEALMLGKRNLVDSIWKSAQIEGLGITFPSTYAILENLPVNTRRDDVYFCCNMKRAWEFVFDNVDYPVNLSFLREINKISMENLIYNPGEIRKIPVSIGGTSWQPDIPIESIISENLRKISDIKDKTDSALELYCYLARTQTFMDGNKRLANLCCNKTLMEHNIGILSIPTDKVKDHVKLLIDFYETNDNTELKDFLRETSIQFAKGLTTEFTKTEIDEGDLGLW